MQQTSTSKLTCARCGYSLRGIELDAACPECGQEVVESILHHRKYGTGWFSVRNCLIALALLSLARDAGLIALVMSIDDEHTYLNHRATFLLFTEFALGVFLLGALPRIKPSDYAWHAPEQGRQWWVAMALAYLACFLAAFISYGAFIAAAALYIALRTVTWICALLCARNHDHHAIPRRAVSLWSLAALLTLILPPMWLLLSLALSGFDPPLRTAGVAAVLCILSAGCSACMLAARTGRVG